MGLNNGSKRNEEQKSEQTENRNMGNLNNITIREDMSRLLSSFNEYLIVGQNIRVESNVTHQCNK